MKKLLTILAFTFGALFAATEIDVNGVSVQSKTVQNQKGGFYWKVCQESTYVDSAGSISTRGTWVKDNTGYTCIAANKQGGRTPIQLTTLAITYSGSKADSSLFDVRFRVKDNGESGVGRFVGSSSLTMDTSITTISQTTSATYFVGALAFPEADSLCFRLAPSTNTQNLACTVDSTVITRIRLKIK